MKGNDIMSNSSLVNYTKISPNRGNYINGVRQDGRTNTIKKITIHHMACNGTLESVGNDFARPARECSSNYAIDSNGRVAMYCEEINRSWCSGNAENDNQAITIEVANDGGAPNWHISDKALAKLIDLCIDICKRNGIRNLNFTGDKTGNLTMHKYFQNTTCPGAYLGSKFPYIAEEVNKELNNKETLTETVKIPIKSSAPKPSVKPVITTKPKVIYQVYAKNSWLPEITNYNEVNSNGYAGIFGSPISGLRVKLSNGQAVHIQSHINGNKANDWLPKVSRWDNTDNGYSGWKGKPTDCIAIKADSVKFKYRVHILGGKWLDWVTAYNLADSINGLAGIYGKTIDAIQIGVV